MDLVDSFTDACSKDRFEDAETIFLQLKDDNISVNKVKEWLNTTSDDSALVCSDFAVDRIEKEDNSVQKRYGNYFVKKYIRTKEEQIAYDHYYGLIDIETFVYDNSPKMT